MLRCRALQLVALAWTLACIGVVLPAHDHRVGHAHEPSAVPRAGLDQHDSAEAGHDGHDGEEGGHDPDHCTVCHLASALAGPRPVAVTIPVPQRAEVLRPTEPAVPATAAFPLPYDERGPPAVPAA